MAISYEITYREVCSYGKIIEEAWEAEYYDLTRKQVSGIKRYAKEHTIQIDICDGTARDNPDHATLEVYAHSMKLREKNKFHTFIVELVTT